MHEYRSTTIQGAVHKALAYPRLAVKKLTKSSEKFDFAAQMRAGSVLFVGEGNFSFALSMARLPHVTASSLMATVFEAEKDLTDLAYENTQKLLKLGVNVQTDVDATRLSESLGNRRFQTLMFQFPNVASRDPCYGQNPNHVLVTRFLKNCRNHLLPGGLVAITTVDSPFYEGAFKMEQAAQKTGFTTPEIYDFSPNDHPEYTHQNTANEETAIHGHTAFATFVFST